MYFILKAVQNTFWLFNVCNGANKWQTRPTGGGGGEGVLSLVLLTTTRLNSVYHLIIYSGDNSERSLYERRH